MAQKTDFQIAISASLTEPHFSVLEAITTSMAGKWSFFSLSTKL